MKYHEQTVQLTNTNVIYDEELQTRINDTLRIINAELPRSILEWLCIDPHSQLFQKITQFPHYFVEIQELSEHVSYQKFGDRIVRAVEIVFENQGCFVLAASLEDGDDPPVWISRDFYFCGSDSQPTWRLHSHSFSDCIRAFAWDFNIIDEQDGIKRFIDIEQVPLNYSMMSSGPTTYITSAWFVTAEFRRIELDGIRYTILVNN